MALEAASRRHGWRGNNRRSLASHSRRETATKRPAQETAEELINASVIDNE